MERAETAIAGKPYPPAQEFSLKNPTAETASTEKVSVSESKLNVYASDSPLSIYY